VSTTLIAPLGPAPCTPPVQLEVVVIADPLEHLDPAIDTTLALIDAARRRHHRVRWCRAHQLAIRDGRAHAFVAPVGARRDPSSTMPT
jgi:glutathione synthase